jgi:hypothetical protein
MLRNENRDVKRQVLRVRKGVEIVVSSVQEKVMFVSDAVCPSECGGSVWLSVRSWSAPHDAIFLILVSRRQSEVCGEAQPGADESRRGPQPDSLLRRGRH